MGSKFKVGDRVIIRRDDTRIPKDILASIRLDHPRTITAVFYDQRTQHNRYYLGSNNKGGIDWDSLSFRPESLMPYHKGIQGRKRGKRRYKVNPGRPQGISVRNCA